MARRKSWEKYLIFIVRQMPAEVRSEIIDHADEVLNILVKEGIIDFSHPYLVSEEVEEGENFPLQFH